MHLRAFCIIFPCHQSPHKMIIWSSVICLQFCDFAKDLGSFQRDFHPNDFSVSWSKCATVGPSVSLDTNRSTSFSSPFCMKNSLTSCTLQFSITVWSWNRWWRGDTVCLQKVVWEGDQHSAYQKKGTGFAALLFFLASLFLSSSSLLLSPYPLTDGVFLPPEPPVGVLGIHQPASLVHPLIDMSKSVLSFSVSLQMLS